MRKIVKTLIVLGIMLVNVNADTSSINIIDILKGNRLECELTHVLITDKKTHAIIKAIDATKLDNYKSDPFHLLFTKDGDGIIDIDDPKKDIFVKVEKSHKSNYTPVYFSNLQKSFIIFYIRDRDLLISGTDKIKLMITQLSELESKGDTYKSILGNCKIKNK